MLGNPSIRSVQDCASLSQHPDCSDRVRNYTATLFEPDAEAAVPAELSSALPGTAAAFCHVRGRFSCPYGSAMRPPAPPSGAAWSSSTARGPGLPESFSGPLWGLSLLAQQVAWSRPRSSWSSTTATAQAQARVASCRCARYRVFPASLESTLVKAG